MRYFYLFFILMFFEKLHSQKEYFQQDVSYLIHTRLNDVNHELLGDIRITYVNRSPDLLDKIGFHLWPNAYKNNLTAFAKQKLKHRDTRFYDAREDERGYIDKLDFKVNGLQAHWIDIEDNPDMVWLQLPEALRPGDSIIITTPFHVKLPESFSRLGHAAQTYQITQWYPKPAVYDHKGWQLMPYLDQGEFYSEFGDFEVYITLPQNYVVGATGILQNEDEYVFLEKRIQETQDAIQNKKLLFEENIPSDSIFKTLHYKAQRVHDFAWFADKAFYVQKSAVILSSGNKVTTWTMFNNVPLWDSSIHYVNRAVEFYSSLVGEYPWPQATAVESALSAGGGMEYPMITVIGPMDSKESLDEVITHEVGHNWFYGILGSNEREHPYMDEGINTYYENRYMKTFYGERDAIELPDYFKKMLGKFKLQQLMYLTMARAYIDQHPNQPSDHFTIINYGNDVYYKTANLFAYAEKVIGRSAFDSTMQHYYSTWKFRHPYPEDLQKIFEEKIPADTKWLFDGFLNSDQKMDYAFCKIKKKNQQLNLTIRNKEKIAAPFSITGIKGNSPVQKIWIDGFTGKQTLSIPDQQYDYLAIDHDQESYDLYDNNNYIRTRGMFKKLEPVKITALPLMDKAGISDLGITPVAAYNLYNGFMAGLFISGPWFPYKNCSVNLLPLYGFKNNKLAGKANFRYTYFTPGNKSLKNLSLGLHYKSFAYLRFIGDKELSYNQFNPYIEIEFRHKPSSFINSALGYEAFVINDEYADYADTIPVIEKLTRTNHQLNYHISKNSILGNTKFTTTLNYLNQKFAENLQQEVLRVQLEFEKSFRYQDKRYFNSRFYLAFYPVNSERKSTYISIRSNPNFYRSSTGLAYQNYLDDDNEDLFIGRSAVSGFWSQQIFIKQGGFKLTHGATQRSNPGNTNAFLCSANFSSELPFKYLGKHIRPYFDIGATSNFDGLNYKMELLYSGGINLSIIPGILDFYFPVLHSKNISDLYKSRPDHNYWDEVSFQIKIRKLQIDDLLHLLGY